MHGGRYGGATGTLFVVAEPRLLLQNGRNDLFVPPQAATALHAAITSPKTVEWYESGHGLPRAALDSRVRWLSSKPGLTVP
jgi:predicted esterase